MVYQTSKLLSLKLTYAGEVCELIPPRWIFIETSDRAALHPLACFLLDLVHVIVVFAMKYNLTVGFTPAISGHNRLCGNS